MTPHPMARTRRSLWSFGAASLLALAATAQVVTAPGTTGIDASGNYQAEVQACTSGRTQQDLETCLREARNARADKQRGALSADPQVQANARARCEPLSGEEKAACEARVLGLGQASGSVEGGGVIRQVETVVMPPGTQEITIEPKTANPVVLVPVPVQPKQ